MLCMTDCFSTSCRNEMILRGDTPCPLGEYLFTRIRQDYSAGTLYMILSHTRDSTQENGVALAPTRFTGGNHYGFFSPHRIMKGIWRAVSLCSASDIAVSVRACPCCNACTLVLDSFICCSDAYIFVSNSCICSLKEQTFCNISRPCFRCS